MPALYAFKSLTELRYEEYLGTYRGGSRDGTVVRALTSHQCGLDSIPTRCHSRVDFVDGSRLASRVSGSGSNSTMIQDPHENQPLRLMWLPL